ncbi:MAG: hypothetical protein PWQ88_654 [Candidatus Methanomethylophilaceae archaeon]|nr:hypothetical protein [Candidatus Methanomethylophilaceae archaeon]MDI3542255.1 hypothetical protein [Candidatus Methanomethylophilaceae archaeon]HIJ00395.1 DUF2085 domain-containing protein [Candidatus Methanomethylophilaceae archaeon]
MKSAVNPPEFALFLIFGVLAAALIIIPISIPAGQIHGLDGTVGIIDNGDLWKGLDPIRGTAYQLGDALCHQKESRSILINGNQMPICARDAGIVFGLFLGFLISGLLKRRVPWVVVLIMLVPILLDGGTQLVTNYESTNFIRLITGLLSGTALAFGMMLIFDSMVNEVGEAGRNRKS